MNLLQARALDQFYADLTIVLGRCATEDQILVGFSSYLLDQFTRRSIEDYEFYPEFTPTETLIKVYVWFPWDSGARCEFTVKKDDTPSQAYTRAMGII